MLKFLLFSLIIGVAQAQEGCVFNVEYFSNSPIFLNQTTYSFVYPSPFNDEEDRHITMSVGDTIIFACPQGNITIDDVVQPSSIYVTCNEDSEFSYNEETFDIKSLSCSKFRFETVRSTGESCGTENGRLYVIGFEVDLSIGFVPLLTVCFDMVMRTPIWINNMVSTSIIVGQHNFLDYFYDTDIYNLQSDINFKEIYTVPYQRARINSLVGLPEDSHKYIFEDKPLDVLPLAQQFCFVYSFQGSAVSHYIATVPQFKLLNGYYNWYFTEVGIWQYTTRNLKDLDVFTGIYGVATLPHEETGEEIEIYLYQDGDTPIIPVPEILWKLVVDPISRTATAFVTINNSFDSNITAHVLCTDITDQLDFIFWVEPNDAFHGYSYSCTYEDLKKSIPYLPDLDVVGILT